MFDEVDPVAILNTPTFPPSPAVASVAVILTAGVTVTVHVLENPPCAEVTVIVAVPTAFAVTVAVPVPVATTEATEVLELVHVTFLFVAFAGV
jgi:hypothetical protein